MPDIADAHARPTAADRATGCVVFLVEESHAMEARVAGGTKTKALCIATALNSLLNQLAAGPELDVALIGYRAGDGADDVGPRWGGALAGRRFVRTGELAEAPSSVETRVRKVPAPGGVGVAREENVRFPIWYVPTLSGPASRSAAYEHCRQALAGWLAGAAAGSKPPMVVSFVGEPGGEQAREGPWASILEMDTPGGPPLVLYAHLSSSDRVPATLYPSSDAHLAPGPVRTLFHAASPLPDEFLASLRQLQVTVNAGARGLVYNARMGDLIRLLSLVKTYARYEPPASDDAAPSQPATPGASPTPEPAPGESAPDESALGAEVFSADISAVSAGSGAAGAPEESITMPPAGEVTVTDLLAGLEPGAEGAAPESFTVQMPGADAPTVEVSLADAATGPAGFEHGTGTEVAASSGVPLPAEPQPTPEKPQRAAPETTARRALVVLLADRSVADPAGAERKSVWHRLQEHANGLLAQLAKRGEGRFDCALVVYGSGRSGETEVATTFSGPLTGRSVVADADLGAGAMRVDETTEKVSNGIGGLISVTRKRPIYLDREPAAAADPSPAFAAVEALVADWRRQAGAGDALPVVLHLTRGQFDPEVIERAMSGLRRSGPVALYHLVLTEAPHPSVSYPAEPAAIRDAALKRLWELSSPLHGAEAISARKPAVRPASRGIVINGKFDVFVDAIEAILAAPGGVP